MKILITGGGTGGHLAIAKALGQELKEMGVDLIYVGSLSGQDREWFGKSELFCERYFLPSQGVVDKKGIAKVAALGQILKSSLSIMPKIKEARAVISVGGFSAAPASFGALLASRPLFIHEQNAHIGTLNRIFKPFAKRFFSSFEPPFDPYPIAKKFFQNARPRQTIKSIIFLGGSQGARAINEFALQVAPILHQKGISIIHQTGKSEYSKIRKAYADLGIEADIFAFSPSIDQKIAKADFAISRAGASTAWELAANGLPALFVPYPFAAGDHQYHNARYFVDKGAALVERQSDLSPKSLHKIFSADITAMSHNLLSLARPDGARILAQEILKSL
ncbi:MAG: UDP-N-acetylglucosamine--N-acetylmuramyl-(pentapeptide) pyrophosphoryl-undecaprenol N-acetylglucosamine transferase [Epsilonproteobacteria bacterium]|nr:UDP-N-acetylglucosamine--N-acetylmuramyl-(pentapeptide) pyrophosphoryl-undecaprenol N-acetylglucosamine transferase [Campylobacterota bacterium]NPA64642.1 UDP-N-acetylglucosamine--N-acetylmuramyl-(pentapeptide) pyrophosphoryl-undecaprenol N-acetylglucosamine transferase [Campylobacterota bacterium]